MISTVNPEGVVRGEHAKFADPTTLDLHGLGVRSLSVWRGSYLIAAGHFADGGTSKLFTWNGRSQPVPVAGLDFHELNPEGFFTPDGRDRFLLLSDDGSLPLNGVPCKDSNAREKRFRGAWVSLASPT